jgi:hypothetical protein
VSGTPDDNSLVGWYWVNVTVYDGNGGEDSRNYSIQVNNTPPQLTTTPITSALEGMLHLDDFNCDDDNQGDITYSINSNASWLNLFPITGILSGIPLNAHVGWFWVNVTVDDGNAATDFLNYTLDVINVNDHPVITTENNVIAIQDTPYSMDYEADDIDPTGDNLTWNLGTNATWLSMNSSTGLLAGIPDNGDVGSYWVNVSVDDGNGGEDYTNFTLTVDDANDPPVITTPDVAFVLEDMQYSVDYNFTDIDDQTGTWYLDTNASWLIINKTNGLLVGLPENGDVGWCWVNVSIVDARGGIDYSNFTLSVNNTPPLLIYIPTEFVSEDDPIFEDFNCTDDNQGDVFYGVTTNASWLAMDHVTGILSGIPNNTQTGYFWVNVTVFDGNGGTDHNNYTLMVNNTPPSITTDPPTMANEDSLYIVDFDCSDDGQGQVIYSLQSNASWCNIDADTGIVTGIPINDDVGTYWINVTVDDGNGGVDYINYTVNVENTNDPPIITTSISDVYTQEDSQYYVDFDYADVDGDSVVWSVSSNASWLVIDKNIGVLSGLPVNDDVGMYSVNITTFDNHGGYAYVNFTITVNNTNDPPGIPELLSPLDDSTINTTFPTFYWESSIDQDPGDRIVNYTLEYSTTPDFSHNITTITGIINTSYRTDMALLDKISYYWHVEALDLKGTGSGFQVAYFEFTVDTGYVRAFYKGGIKSAIVDRGQTWSIDLNDFFQLGSVIEDIEYSCNYEEITIDPKTHVASWKPDDEDRDLIDVVFTLYDGSNSVESSPIDIQVKDGVEPMPFWIILLFILILIGIVGVFVVYRELVGKPVVEQVFLISEDGRLLAHASLIIDEEMDQDILSGMLTGVKDLITDAFIKDEGGEEGLHKLEFGDKNILLEKGYHFFVAVLFSGRENRDLLARAKIVVDEVEEKYGHVFEDWDGEMEAFDGAFEIIGELLTIENLPED